MKIRLLFLLAFFFFISQMAMGGGIDRGHWRELKKGLHYKKAKAGEKAEYFEEWSKSVNEEKGSGRDKKSSGIFSKKRKGSLLSKPRKSAQDQTEADEKQIPSGVVFMIYIVVGVILLVVIYFLFFHNARRNEKAVVLNTGKEEIQVDIPFNELEELLNKAIQQGNYREAVRIYFIFIIKTLREKNWINWELKKTNSAYLYEMRSRRQYESFSQAVLIFEIVWYGKREIGAEQYEQIRPRMEALLQSLKRES